MLLCEGTKFGCSSLQDTLGTVPTRCVCSVLHENGASLCGSGGARVSLPPPCSSRAQGSAAAFLTVKLLRGRIDVVEWFALA